MTGPDAPLEQIVDDETYEAWRVLKNSVRTPGSVFDRAARAIEALARDRYHLLVMTAHLDEHPEGYNGDCWCAACRRAAAGGGDVAGPPATMA